MFWKLQHEGMTAEQPLRVLQLSHFERVSISASFVRKSRHRPQTYISVRVFQKVKNIPLQSMLLFTIIFQHGTDPLWHLRAMASSWRSNKVKRKQTAV